MSKYAGTKTEKNLMDAFAGESIVSQQIIIPTYCNFTAD